MSAVGSNYMSDGAILAWVTEQQNRLYGNLEDTMQQQQLQSKMADDLADIKQHLQAANKDPTKFAALDDELKKFQENYGSNPQFDELTSTVGGIQTEIEKRFNEVTASADYQKQVTAATNAGTTPPQAQIAKFDDDTVTSWTSAIDKKLSDAGTNEQLGMVQINEVKSTIDQGTQMASQLIKSSNDSMASVIHNIA